MRPHPVLILALLAGSASAQCPHQLLTAPVPTSEQCFGQAIGLHGNVLAIGNPYHDQFWQNVGTVRIFRHNGQDWLPEQVIDSPFTSSNGHHFGYAIDADGDWLIVGEPGYASDRGAASFFRRTAAGWEYTRGFATEDAGDWGGFSVAIDGEYAIFGAPNVDPPNLWYGDIGCAIACHRIGNQWEVIGAIYSSGLGWDDHTGKSVDVRGTQFMAGVPGRLVGGHPRAGAAIVTSPGAQFEWIQDPLIKANDPQQDANFGASVALGDGFAVAGAPNMDIGLTPNCGAVYIFQPGPLGTWLQAEKLTSPFRVTDGHFGEKVAVDGDRIIIGEPGTGKAHIYRRSPLGAWVLEWQLHDPFAPGQGFGDAVAIQGNTAVVSSEFGSIGPAISAGYANVFDIQGAFGADSPVFAPLVAPGTYYGCTDQASPGGDTTCGNSASSRDVYFRFIAPCTADIAFSTQGSNFDTVLSIHASGTATPANTIACSDNAPSTLTSLLTIPMTQGQTRYIRIAGNGAAVGRYTLTITACGQNCYANCDASTGAPFLTANDFQCFLNKFAAGDEYANCDGSGGTPTLTANDFQCFLNKFAAGCS